MRFSTPAVNVVTKAVKIAIGQSKTIDVSLYSDAPTTGPWTVSVAELPDVSPSGNLTFALDKTQGINGDHLKLTITVKGYDATASWANRRTRGGP